jgi:hypothetical protein
MPATAHFHFAPGELVIPSLATAVKVTVQGRERAVGLAAMRHVAGDVRWCQRLPGKNGDVPWMRTASGLGQLCTPRPCFS